MCFAAKSSEEKGKYLLAALRLKVTEKQFSSFFPRFSVYSRIFRKLSKNSSIISLKIIAHEFYQKYFPEFYNFPMFSVNSETILVNLCFRLNPSGRMALS